jgi:DNA invertase Pin-like site-specific DNA recombinase
MNNNYIAYYRVSTKDQGRSGLGLEAQEATVKEYCLKNDLNLIASYTEVETSTKDTLENRPVLQKALGHSKRISAVLIIAKLDRLSRSVYVTSLLHKSGVEFLCCDMPLANRFTINILAAVAEQEAQMISERTKAALKALKARGIKLGTHRPECANNLSEEGRQLGNKRGSSRNRQIKKEAYADILPEIVAMRHSGMQIKDITLTLNDKGYTTRTGCGFHTTTVRRLLALGV